MSEPIVRLELFVPTSEDGETAFTEIADILDHLATLYRRDPYAAAFLQTRAFEARKIDVVHQKKEVPWTRRIG